MDLQLNEVSVEREIGGRTLKLSTGLMAKQAAGAVVVQYGGTVVLTAVTCDKPRFAGQDFFPLMVDYREKAYAAGKFPGGFFKREKAPSVKEILTMRLADRPIRPLFPKNYRKDVIVQSLVLSSDMENEADVLSIIGASAAIFLSPMPFAGPIGAVRMGFKDGQPVINPTMAEMKANDLNLVLAGTSDNVTMVEASANELTEEQLLVAIEKGHEVSRIIVEMQRELREKANRPEAEAAAEPDKPACLEAVRQATGERIQAALATPTKFGRRDAVQALRDEVLAAVAVPEGEEGPSEKEVKEAFEIVRAEAIRAMTKAGKRIDGRDFKTVRSIDCRVGLLPQVHGSALFTRGETQSLVSVTLGTVTDTQKVDGLLPEIEYEHWFLHYQAPGFSVGESRPPRGPSRRDIGHGMLGQRALVAVMPHNDGFPYTVRAVGEILEMNGSSSMATVCGATLALMDAGVPLKRPVAGIAMGLIQDPGEEPVILSDILGDEDHCGDMDFKVCGTSAGITALQMDVKVAGISSATISQALEQAREGRLHILDCMAGCLAAPRSEINPLAPRIHTIPLDPDSIGKVIGPGGKTIRAIQDKTGSRVDIDDSGVVTICAPDTQKLQECIEMIEGLVAVPEVGQIYEGPVKSVRDFGAFIEILPGTDGMCHISELSDTYIENIGDACKVGDKVKVKVIGIDDMGRVRLSRRAVICEEKGVPYEPRETRSPRSGDRGGRGKSSERRPVRR